MSGYGADAKKEISSTIGSIGGNTSGRGNDAKAGGMLQDHHGGMNPLKAFTSQGAVGKQFNGMPAPLDHPPYLSFASSLKLTSLKLRVPLAKSHRRLAVPLIRRALLESNSLARVPLAGLLTSFWARRSKYIITYLVLM